MTPAKQPAPPNIFRPLSKSRFFNPRSTAGASVSSFQSVTAVRPANSSAIAASGDFFSDFLASTVCNAIFSSALRLASASVRMNSMNFSKLAPPR